MTAEDLCMAIKALPWGIRDKQAPHLIAAALHREREEALNEAAQRIAWLQPEHNAREAQRQIRELKSPAAAPAAEPSEPVAPAPALLEGWCNHGAQAHPCAIPRAEKAEKRIAELEAELYRLRDLYDPGISEWSRISMVLMGIAASPVAQGKEKG